MNYGPEALYYDRTGKIYTQDDLDYEVEQYAFGMTSRGVPKNELYNESDVISILELVEIDQLELLHEEGFFVNFRDILKEYTEGKNSGDPNYTDFESIADYISSLTWHHAACMWIDSKTEIKPGWYLVECHNDAVSFSIVTNGDGKAYYL